MGLWKGRKIGYVVHEGKGKVMGRCGEGKGENTTDKGKGEDVKVRVRISGVWV